MTNRILLRSLAEAALGVVSALALLLTMMTPDWIERIFGLKPDGGNGQSEWIWTLALVFSMFLLFADVWRLHTRSRPASGSNDDEPASLNSLADPCSRRSDSPVPPGGMS